MTLGEFARAFSRELRHLARSEAFRDGSLIHDYAMDAAEAYYNDPEFAKDPYAAAVADFDCWEE